jgi:F-type H+-transporting ATPase subunit b
MNMAALQSLASGVLSAEFDVDDKGYTSSKPILPPIKELFIGSAASLIVFAMLYKFAWPQIKAGMAARTERIQTELDDSAAARTKAESDATEIRKNLGDVDGERSRLFADADAQATALLEDGRARLATEVADLEAKAEVDMAAAAGRGADDLRADIARYSSQAIEQAVTVSLDDATQQELIEGFIARVGAGNAS